MPKIKTHLSSIRVLGVAAPLGLALLALFSGPRGPANAQETGSPPATGSFQLRSAAETGLAFTQKSGTAAQKYIVDVKSTGVALLDFDRDGLLDVFLTAGSSLDRHVKGSAGYGCRLFRNLGKLRFENVTTAAQIPDLGWACAVAAADWNGDGWDDLLVTCIGPDRLLTNREGRFVEETPPLPSSGWSTGAAFADLDGDADLDVYIAGYVKFDFDNPPVHGAPGWSCLYRGVPIACGPRGFDAEPDRVFEQRDGKLHDVTSAWGFADGPPQFGLGVLIADLVGDARPEVFVANDATQNLLFTRRKERFEEIGFFAGIGYNEDGEEQAGMGVDAADVDGDGDLDVIVTNFEQEKNNLYVNQGNELFVDRNDYFGIGVVGRPYLSWGTGFRDFNNDGVLDLFIANGHVYPEADDDPKSAGYAQRDHLFFGIRESDRVRFVERGSEVGITEKGVGRAATFGDLDNDGDLDIIVCNLNAEPFLYENRAPAAHKSLTITLEQPGPNPQALGARVTTRVGSVQRVQEARRNDSFQASSDPRLHVGLGTNPPAGTAVVRWPDGTTEQFATPAGGGAITLVRSKGSSPTEVQPGAVNDTNSTKPATPAGGANETSSGSVPLGPVEILVIAGMAVVALSVLIRLMRRRSAGEVDAIDS